MNTFMKRLILVCMATLALSEYSHAMADPPLEFYLQRAETVTLAKVASITKNSATALPPYAVTVHPTQRLRGVCNADWTILGYEPMKIGTELLLISQGDFHYGPPSNQILINLKGQGVWCGWISLPVIKAGDQTYAERCFSFIDGEPYTDAPHGVRIYRLSISRIKRLIERFAYNPHINDKT
jgi:hypothetical protein